MTSCLHGVSTVCVGGVILQAFLLVNLSVGWCLGDKLSSQQPLDGHNHWGMDVFVTLCMIMNQLYLCLLVCV